MTPLLTLYHDGEFVVKVQRQGQVGAGIGNVIESYRCEENGRFQRSWYADHTCGLNVNDAPVSRERIPAELRQWLGIPLHLLVVPPAGKEYALKRVQGTG